MANKYYTVMIVPEKTQDVKRIIIPAYLARGLVVGVAFIFVLALVMFFDYMHVIGRVAENKHLRSENRELKQEIQVFKNKLITIENTLDRVKTFTAKLRIITNLDEKGTPNLELQEIQGTPPSDGGLLQNTGKPSGKNEIKQEANPEVHKDVVKVSPAVQVATIKDDISYERLKEYFEKVDKFSAVEEQDVQDLFELLVDQKSFLGAMPTKKPAAGIFTSGFGGRYGPTNGKLKMHEGLDIAARIGTPVYAPADGVVIFAGPKTGYGKFVVIDHGYNLSTAYAHMNKYLVNEGDKIKRGMQIGEVGNTGSSTGTHLHYEVRINGVPVDPANYILEE